MVKALLSTGSDAQGNLWLDAIEVQLEHENVRPHRIVLRTQEAAEQDQKRGLYLLFERTEAYRLVDLLQLALGAAEKIGAEAVTKSTRLASPLNGGVNTETGEMVLTFKGRSGLEHRFELPFDQSGPLLEIVERAAKTSSEWHDARLTPELTGFQKVDIQPREAESLLLAEDPATGRPILIVRLDGGHQFSFFLDRKIVEQLTRRSQARPKPFEYPTDPWTSIADDIEWFEKEWCTLYEPPSEAEIRRGSAALRRLLVEGWLGKAWRHWGFEKQPSLAGPDLIALLAEEGVEVRHVASLIAGGATLSGIQTAMLGLCRVDNPDTGVSADAEEGFAVKQISIMRDAREPPPPNNLLALVERRIPLSNYLDAAGAIRTGQVISRRDIVAYFANVGGGVHLGPSKNRKDQVHQLIEDLINKIGADTMDGVFFELLSIGQAIGRSEDLKKLVGAIRGGAKGSA